MKQEFKMTVTYNIYAFADGLYEATHILSKAARAFEPCNDAGLHLESCIVHHEVIALDEPFNKARTFQDADEAYSYCTHYSHRIDAMKEVIQYQIDNGFYSFAADLLKKL